MLRPRAAARRQQPVLVLAASGEQAGDDGGGNAPQEPARVVTFQLRKETLRIHGVTQHGMDSILHLAEAIGFRTAKDGILSLDLACLPEDGIARLVFYDELLGWGDHGKSPACSKGELAELRAFVRSHAGAEHAGAPITVLPTASLEPPNEEDRPTAQDHVRLAAAFTVRDTVYLAGYQREVDKIAVEDLSLPLRQIRQAPRYPSLCPDLAPALRGVKRAKLFLAGRWQEGG
ncbi:hypothetical protein ABPG75_008675 [Micractinium tetrahymenae]